MAMTYSTLVADKGTVGSIAYHINWSRIDAEGILEEAQAWIYQRIRIQEMLTTTDVPIASGASTAMMPAGFLDQVHFCIPGVMERIAFREPEAFRTELGWDEGAVLPEGPPTRWTRFDEAMNFDHRADRAYTGKLAFYGRPAALSAANETNFLTERYPHLLRRVCLMFAAEARKEQDLMDRMEVRAMQLVQDIRIESDIAMRGVELDFNWDHN